MRVTLTLATLLTISSAFFASGLAAGEQIHNSIAPGVTREDDGAVVDWEGSFLDGVANRIRLNATDGIGDGSMYLDAYVERSEPAAWDRFAALHVEPHLYPGLYDHGAWFGWWNDLDGNGRIDEFHDSLDVCEPDCAIDEFDWRGIASNEAITMVGWTIPTNAPWGELEGLPRTDPFCGYTPAYNVYNALYYPGYREGDLVRDEYGCATSAFGHAHDGTDGRPDGLFVDETSATQPVQGWDVGHSWGAVFVDEGLLTRAYLVVAADPTPGWGEWQPYSVDGARTLVDVDAYQALSPEIEALYADTHAASSTTVVGGGYTVQATNDATQAAGAQAIQTATNAAYATIVHPVQDAAYPIVLPLAYAALQLVDDAETAINDAFGTVLDTALPIFAEAYRPFAPHVAAVVQVTIALLELSVDTAIFALETADSVPFKAYNSASTPMPREPDNEFDLYPNATFDGVRDLRGLGNDYSDHARDWALFGDVVGQVRIPVAAATLPNGGECCVSGDVSNHFGSLGAMDLQYAYSDPFGAAREDDTRSAPPILGFEGYAVAWKDANGDGWVGNVCDPESDPPEEIWWGCGDPYAEGLYTNPQDWASAKEARTFCAATSLKSGTIEVTPLGGASWPDVVVVRWYDRPMREAYGPDDEYDTEVVNDSRTITIRWDPDYFNCTMHAGGYGRAADEIVFPRGTGNVSFETRSEIVLLKPFVDPRIGADIPAGTRFVDVDLYVAGL